MIIVEMLFYADYDQRRRDLLGETRQSAHKHSIEFVFLFGIGEIFQPQLHLYACQSLLPPNGINCCLSNGRFN